MNNSKPQISIIVPVYNAEKYLRQCLDSIAAQTFKDIEALLINNNSPDGCANIIAEYTAKYPNFKTFFLKGGAAGGARNEGLKHAQGRYIIFLDSDDFITQDMCQKLYDAITNNNADIAGCEHYFVKEDGSCPCPNKSAKSPSFVLDRAKDGPARMLEVGGNLGWPWGKIFNAQFLNDNNIRFPENVPCEDVAFISACFVLAKAYVQTRDLLWYYRYVPTSLSNTKGRTAPKNFFNNFALMRQLLKEKGVYPQIAPEWEYRLLTMLCGGEGVGNGGLKNLNRLELVEFFALAKPFYLSLPKNLFKDKNALFKFKYFLFKTALQYNLYSLPKLSRLPVNIFASVYLPLAAKFKERD